MEAVKPSSGSRRKMMTLLAVDPSRIRNAWEGRISGCQLGKAVEVLSMLQGPAALTTYLEEARALPLRDYVPLIKGSLVEAAGRGSCRGEISRSEPDDDINYTVLALTLLERHGLNLSTEDVARAWLGLLPAGVTYTAERAAYRVLLERAHEFFVSGAPPGFDLAECAQNRFNDWIGAQIRADLYGWVSPGDPALAADLARRDASLSHSGDGVDAAAFVAAWSASIPATGSLGDALEFAIRRISLGPAVSEVVRYAMSAAETEGAIERIRQRYSALPPAHCLNNLAVVAWALLSNEDDYSAAIGDAVAAGWDTDCNGATVGGLWGLSGRPIPVSWTSPWHGRVAVSLAGIGELSIDDLVARTIAVADDVRVARGCKRLARFPI
jgi:ADP-ribosylglycohydrolase